MIINSNLSTRKYNILGVMVNRINYDQAVKLILEKAKEKKSYSVTALAVHGILTGVQDRYQRYRLNNFDMIVPDGQPVRWAINWLYKTNMKERVYGPELMLRLCQGAANEEIPVYLFGSKNNVIQKLAVNLQAKIPKIIIAGYKPSKFRKLNTVERDRLLATIKKSGAGIVFVGIGCPRQEVWTYEFSDYLNLPIIAVGAAFDFHAGLLPQAPLWMQMKGLEWFYRLIQDPKRLWQRYLVLNPIYIFLLILQIIKIWEIDPSKGIQPQEEILYG